LLHQACLCCYSSIFLLLHKLLLLFVSLVFCWCFILALQFVVVSLGCCCTSMH
jgi:hypothetical protein